MKNELAPWRITCLIGFAVFSICALNVVMVEGQAPPYGKDEGLWVLIDKKPDVEVREDNDDSYFGRYVTLSGTTIEGGFSWKDGPDPNDCHGTIWGESSWTELPTVLKPGEVQKTTLKADSGGEQSCSARWAGAFVWFYVNDVKMGEIDHSQHTADPKREPLVKNVSWEVPWGSIGDTLTIVVAGGDSSYSRRANVIYTYSYQAKASDVTPYSFTDEVPQTWGIKATGTTETIEKPLAKGVPDGVPEKFEGEGEDSGVRISGITGEVYIRPHSDEDAWRGAGLKSIIKTGDHIRTGENSIVILSLPDYSKFVMRPETEIIIDTPPEKDSKLALVAGNIWINVKKMLKDGSMEVQMSQAVAGIKGTIIVCEETGTSSILKVLEGTASFKSRTTGEELIVDAGEMAIATASGLSRPQSFKIEEEEKSWENYIPMNGPSMISTSTQNWDPRGDWKFNYYYNGKAYVHDMVIESFDQTTGEFRGYGQDAQSHSWDLSGTFEGDKVEININYTGEDSDYWVAAEGLVSSSTHMSGSAKAPGQTATWDAIKMGSDPQGIGLDMGASSPIQDSGIKSEPYSIAATTQKWDLRGDWKFNYYYNGKTYTHAMEIESFDPVTGEFKGRGNTLFEPFYNWLLSGKVDKDNVKFRIDYINGDGYYVEAEGVISNNAYMKGTTMAPTATWDASKS